MSSSTTDKYGIKKLYADATGSAAQIWYLAMSGNPLSDPRVDSAHDLTMTMSSDGGWILDRPDEPDPSIRLYAYSESGTKKWLNVEITNYSYLIRDTDPGASSNPDLIADYVFHLYTRGGIHNGNRACEGSAYKARLIREKGGTSAGILPGVSFTKELAHDAYTCARTNPEPAQYLEQCGPMDRWIGSKFVVYNLPFDSSIDRTPVKLEFWVDEQGMAKNGVFTPANQNWRKLGETVDSGGWSECLIDGGANGNVSDCAGMEIGNSGQRQCDEILNTGGGTTSSSGGVPAGNAVVYRTDTLITKIKWFSGREIRIPPTPP